MEVEVLILKIKENKFSEKQLINLYNNACAREGIDESDKAMLTRAIEKNTRLRFPRAAKRIFGAKESLASQKLESLCTQLEMEFDLTNNTLKNGVKAGGRMISGEYYIDVYASYKNREKHGASIALTQRNIDAELEVTVRRYRTHSENSGDMERQIHTMDGFDSCATIYRDYLAEIIADGI
ncbi:hypothetical protein LRP49_03755 [Enterovibrio sp. ZSDZ35]|uniref:Uncharacterized protein n=1 Tax=Enterovibrio qingdaonensis TaxID=2899818 RepID=A0ABT5QH51_9GAMM|nr:hypothetical protein [Enterovibrio sp. ZSDZ35]MDD1780309.1 hypothetical protein [Enterovibrio sp. ZSDZ35]